MCEISSCERLCWLTDNVASHLNVPVCRRVKVVVVGHTEVHDNMVQFVPSRRLQIREALKETSYRVVAGKPHLVWPIIVFFCCIVEFNVSLKWSASQEVCQLVVYSFYLFHFSVVYFTNMYYCPVCWGHLQN